MTAGEYARITAQSLGAETVGAAEPLGTRQPPSTAPTIDQYGRDSTALARDGGIDPVIGRDDEIAQTIEVLSRRTKNNPVLLGEPGVGKTAIVEGLAQRVVDGDVPQTLRNRGSYRWTLPEWWRAPSSAKLRGELEEQLKNVMTKSGPTARTWSSSLTNCIRSSAPAVLKGQSTS
jgi:ATP-dependent Clp protease ATP-binding subunit ClpC